MEKITDIGNVTDSDDELLGINDAPVIIRTSSHLSHSRSHQSSHSTCPTMEVIEQSLPRNPKMVRYQRMQEIGPIHGFVVNIHDAVNYDIDLDITSGMHDRYQSVITNQYTYQDIHTSLFTKLDGIKNIKQESRINTAYRCRLRGIGINHLPPHEQYVRSAQMTTEVQQLIDRSDGWVVCTLSDIDVYQRLLVDIIVYTSGGPINIRDFLLDRSNAEAHRSQLTQRSQHAQVNHPLFYMYSHRKHEY
jgi:hypothetical protein